MTMMDGWMDEEDDDDEWMYYWLTDLFIDWLIDCRLVGRSVSMYKSRSRRSTVVKEADRNEEKTSGDGKTKCDQIK